jgi:hypothetical protein
MKFKPLSAILKKNTIPYDIFSGEHDVELTDDVIKHLLTMPRWSNNDWTEAEFKKYQKKGYAYNSKRDSLTGPAEWI